MKSVVRMAIATALTVGEHRDVGVMMYVCGESGVKWDAPSMTRAHFLSCLDVELLPTPIPTLEGYHFD